ncbi:hypothetical protein [Tritonibacter horizontis]|uniref:SHOCT domain-containing protein n=1 Tax=Tritonibacter horizontis TaxID=1768241 RepID=A0A132BYJ9_9RHOB|nr:hypothetical protein [Tritonibacter horizontis]KUP92800.1 hypothetical protein TRIHO_22510 [Tritonibacter horizontis]
MTAILDEIRRLDAARKRGDISAKEYASERGRILASVEDADIAPTMDEPRVRPSRQADTAASGRTQSPHRSARTSAGPAAERAVPREAEPAPQAARTASPWPQSEAIDFGDPDASDDITNFWGLIFIGFCGAGLMTFLVGRLIGDLTIALTLAITVFAAMVIAAFQRMQT